MTNDAIVRRALAKLPEVSKTWIEWDLDGDQQIKNLVVEVSFDTDPNSAGFQPSALDEIRRVVVDALTNQTTMIATHLRVVPKTRT